LLILFVDNSNLNLPLRKMKRVFISYSAKDVQIAKDVYDVLRRLGMEAWLDIYEIRPGDDITDRIEDGIKSCQLFVAIITPNSVGSNWVQKELRLAIEKSEGYNSIVPIILDGIAVPDYIKNIEPVILRPYDYQDLLYRDISTLIDQRFRGRPNNLGAWSSSDEYVQDMSKELSNEFSANPQKSQNKTILEINQNKTNFKNTKVVETEGKIWAARKNLKKASKGYRIKAYIVLGMMIGLLSAAFWLFYNAGNIVAEETKTVIPLIDSARSEKNHSPKKVEAKP